MVNSRSFAARNFGAIIIIGLSLLYVASAIIFIYFRFGVVRESSNLMLWVPWYLGAGALWIAAAIVAVAAVRAAIGKRYDQLFGNVTAAIFATGAPFALYAVFPSALRFAELRDLQRIGIEQLRVESGRLSDDNGNVRDEWRWFGREVPKSDLPPKIASLAVRASYVTASNEGVVLVTDGMTSWSGGYMITPPGSQFVPNHSRKIADGVFYVIAQ